VCAFPSQAETKQEAKRQEQWAKREGKVRKEVQAVLEKVSEICELTL